MFRLLSAALANVKKFGHPSGETTKRDIWSNVSIDVELFIVSELISVLKLKT